MFFLYIPSDSMYTLERPVIVKADNRLDADNAFDAEYGYYPDLPRGSYDSVWEMVVANKLRKAIICERVDTVGFKHGTDSDEFAELFSE